MRRIAFLAGVIVAAIQPVLGGIFGDSSKTTASDSTAPATTTSSSSSSSSSSSTNTSVSEVAFLQTLQAAQISSMSCIISLVNMTTNPIGTCLGLSSLAGLIVAPPSSNSSNISFSDQLNEYLETTQLQQTCSGSGNTALIQGFDMILENYQTSYRTLACSIHYNGTNPLCLPAALNTSSTANSNAFFNSLISASNLDQYSSSVFSTASCTGCIYEMYKSAVYTISNIRGNSLTGTFGDHLKNDCPNDPTTGSTIDWKDVEDQQIPDALQVQQSTGTANAATRVDATMLVRPLVIYVIWTGMIAIGGWWEFGRRVQMWG
ncbi:MAG: hypothetical protein TREMPRED_001399 [Tremellales sp. Tagirdzhanova-0007]|nr:MAG: hypothetical protein TREMPRED_001399 [Tremellales sp. Tagirdzhanova-0007]